MSVPLKLDITTGDKITPRDYYDVYILAKLQYKNIDIESLKTALRETSEKRGSTEVLKDYVHIIDVVRNSEVMIRQWKTYQKDFEYASGISHDDACDAVVFMMDLCYE